MCGGGGRVLNSCYYYLKNISHTKTLIIKTPNTCVFVLFMFQNKTQNKHGQIKDFRLCRIAIIQLQK